MRELYADEYDYHSPDGELQELEQRYPADQDSEDEVDENDDGDEEEELKEGEKEPDLSFANEQMGTTEYCLIGLWAVFTAGIFALLYRIT